MKKHQAGFSVIEALLFVVVVVLLVGASLAVYHRRQANVTTVQTADKTETVTANGTTDSIDKMTAQDGSSEAAIDTKYSNTENSTAQSANSAASNMGGAYNESSL